MAGIGFVLRKLSQRNDIMSVMEAYFRASVVSAGPWLITVFTLGVVMVFGKELLPIRAAHNFQSIIIYNFCFTLVLTSPLSLTATRHLADKIYAMNVSTVPGMVVGTLALMYFIEAPLCILFYFGYAKITFMEAALASTNFLLICTVWMVTIYITALADYEAVTRGYVIGMLVGLVLTIYGTLMESVGWMLFGFNSGLAVIIALLISEIYAEYPYAFRRPFEFMEAYPEYKEVTLSALAYNMAIWIDKWVMWASPEAIMFSNGLILFPFYDLAAFLAYFITIPAMSLFLISIETEFFEKYVKFYDDIRHGATFRQIVNNQNNMQRSLVLEFKTVVILQGTLAVLVLVIAPEIFSYLKINFSLLGIFRYCVVGASYQVFLLFLSFILWYFDARRRALFVHVLFLVSNFLFTWLTLQLGPDYYGLGFALSAILTFIVAAVITEDQIRNLPYHTFISNNTTFSEVLE